MNPRLLIGAMSGTSADGVDTALVRIGGRGLSMSAELVKHHHRGYPINLRKTLFEVRTAGRCELSTLAALSRDITLAHAAAVHELLGDPNVRSPEIAAIAVHGQTLFHSPPNTIQWFDPSLLAWKTQCAVVSDFRRADCAAGGQGAPLVPFADYVLFRDPIRNRVLLNIGGIANLTYLKANGSIDQVIAFDTGPGNCLSDWLCRGHDPSGPGWDAGGNRAAKGRVVEEFVANFLAADYLSRRPPKSTDTSEMVEQFKRSITSDTPPDDLLATAAYVTGRSIADGIASLHLADDFDLIVSGGGTHNRQIMSWLQKLLQPTARIQSTDAVGVPSETKEAVAFALLGAATLDGFAANVPSVTGASRSVVLGSITPKP